MAKEAPSATRVAALFLAYARGDFRPPSQPGGQNNRPQRQQTPELRKKRQKEHRRNKSRDNRAARKRYHAIYKRRPQMKKRQVLYRKNPNKYNRKGPRKYERPDPKRVMARFLEAGAVILYDQQNPANNEIKNPGKDVNYRAVGPTTWTVAPDEQGGVEPGAGINDQTKNVPPASSRVIPDQMKQTLQDNLTYVQAARRRRPGVSKWVAQNKIYDQVRDIEYGSAKVVRQQGSEWLMTYRTQDGQERKVLVGGHESGPGSVYLSVRKYGSTQRVAAAKIDKIMGNCGPKIVQRSNGIQFRRKRILPKHGMLIYEVRGSVGGKSDGMTYTVRIKGERKGNVKALAKMPVKVSCSCPYFRWQGPEHWAKVNGYLYGRPVGTASKPVIKDPKDQHWVCKHVYAILKAKKGLRFASEGWNPGGTSGPVGPIDLLDLSPLPDPVRVAYRYLRENL